MFNHLVFQAKNSKKKTTTLHKQTTHSRFARAQKKAKRERER